MKIVSATVAIVLAILSFLATLLERPPATFFLELFASDIDGRVPFVASWGATMLCGLIPYGVLVAVIGRFTATRATESVPAGTTGLWVTRPMHWPGAVLNASVFIDDKRVASLPVGRTVFLELTPGAHEVRLGKGKDAAACTVQLPAGEQLRATIMFTNGAFMFSEAPALRAA